MHCSFHQNKGLTNSTAYQTQWLSNIVTNFFPPYNEIFYCQQGGIALTQLVLDEIFSMLCDFVNELKHFLKAFETKGLT